MSKLVDLTGRRFNKRVVMYRVFTAKGKGTAWLVRCKCGKEDIVNGSKLTAGLSGSCATCAVMSKIKNMLGQKVGSWTVYAQDTSNWDRGVRWLVRCECGFETSVHGAELRRGHTVRCFKCANVFRGTGRKLGQGESGFNMLIATYKRSATERKLLFLLNENQVKILTKLNCYYCGCVPKQQSVSSSLTGKAREHAVYIYNGIDRVNNSAGYIDGNVVPCCITCNIMKNTLGEQEFYAHIERVIAHRTIYPFINRTLTVEEQAAATIGVPILKAV